MPIRFLSNTLSGVDANTHIEAYLRALVDVGVGYSYPGQVEDIERAFLGNYLSKIPAPVIFDIGANVELIHSDDQRASAGCTGVFF